MQTLTRTENVVLFRLIKAISAALVILLASFSSIAQNQVAKQTPAGTWYLEYLPPDYNLNSNKYPIMIFCHGIGERGDTEATVVNVAANGPPKHVKYGYKFPFILISPQLKTSYNRWPIGYVDEVLEYCKTYLRVDVSRIYLAGLSLGGGAVWDYSQDPILGQKLAAVVPVCGGFNNPNLACNFGITNLPVWAFHGDIDPIVPLSRSVNMVNAINACTPAPNPLAQMTIYPGVKHNSWDNAFRTDNLLHTPNVYQWLAQFKNGSTIADAGPDRTITLPTNSLTITGSASVQGASITSYTWTRVSGSGGTMSNTTSPTLTLTNLVVGTYTFRLMVKASNGEMAQDLVKVTVKDGNSAPVANAGPDVSITLPTNSATINGSGSDANGSITAYAWTKISGPTATASGTTTATLSLSNLIAGTYVYSLKVTDNAGAIGTDEVTIVVNSSAVNQLPTVNAGADKTINLPTSTANLTAVASDADGTITSYLWQKTSGPSVTMTNTTNPTLSLSSLVQGTYIFSVTVTDNNSGTASDLVTVTVIAANQAPSANAGQDVALTLPTNSTNLVGTGSDADGSVASYAWIVVSGPNTPTLSNASSATASLSGLIAGTYLLRLTVTDNAGATAIDEVQVQVNPAVVNVSPVANAGGNKIIYLPTTSTSLTGSGSDADGSVTSYAWVQTGGFTATLTNSNTPTLTISDLAEGVYKFMLTVTDNKGATATDVATVSVVSSNQAPMANAGADANVTLPTSTVVLTGSGSDLDGSVSSYLWEKVSGPDGVNLTNASTASVTVTSLVEGTYIFSLTVTDNQGATDSDEVTVTVSASAANVAPQVHAGADQLIKLPTNSIVLNGAASDADGTIASYSWTLVSGPACTLTDANTANLSLSDLVAGSYLIRLTVLDNSGASATDEVTVTVQPETVNESPVANAGADISLTLPANSAVINGAGTDTDGVVTSYEWTLVSGGAGTMSGETTASLQIAGLSEGSYSFRLTVTDDKGATGSDIVIVTVQAMNQAPTANAGADVTLDLPTNSVTITGSGTDVDGTIASYLWSQTDGPSSATMADINLPALSVSNLVQGTYVFTLTVTDNDALIGSDQVKVIVNAANMAPTANAGAAKTITLPTNTAVLNGSGSDPDGTIAGYSWTQISGPGTATLSNATTASLTVVAPAQGVYIFRLTVTDNDGATGFNETTLTVKAQATNQSPTANAGPNKTITLPINSVNLSGSGSDPDGSIASYAWTKISGPAATMKNANTSTLSLSNLVEGNYVFRLTVTDNGGLKATSDVSVTVFPQVTNTSPIANAGADGKLTLPTNSINLVGSGTDPDGSILSYQWTKVSGPSVTMANETSPTLTLTNLVEGTYKFQLTVKDDKGATGTDEVLVVVNAATANQLPVANAGPDRTIKLPVNSVTITGSGSDPDGSISSYMWTKVSGPTVSLSGTTTPTLSASNLVAGTYVFRLKVTDNASAVASDDVTVLVQAETVNQAPVANGGGNKTITLPTNAVNLSGSGSDPDGGIILYAWTKISGPSGVLTNQSTPTLSVTDMVEGTYVFRLTVTDDRSSIDTDDVTVVVNAAATNVGPTANAGPDVSVKLPTSLATLNGSGTDTDGSIATYSWLKVSGPAATMGNVSGPSLTVSNLMEGVYVFRLTVTDNSGASSFDEANVTVIPATTNSVPEVNAGPDQTIFSPANTAILDATASDADGKITTVSWTKISGTCTIANPSNLFTQVTGLVEGTARLRVTVTDDKGATAFDELDIVVNPASANQPPLANAGPDKSVKLPTSSMSISGSSADPDGTISSYLWVQLSGPEAVLTNETSANVTVSNLAEGTYVFRFKVTDDKGASTSDDMILEVLSEAANTAPVASAGLDQTVTLPAASVQLNGSATDDDQVSVTAQWEIISGPGGSIANADQFKATLNGLVEGEYVLRLTVTDAGSLSDFDEVTILVLKAEPVSDPPVVVAGDDVTVQLPYEELVITATAESPSGLIVSYHWDQTSGPPLLINETDTTSLVLKNFPPGVYNFAVTVKDNEGREASDDVIITVLEADIHPHNLFSPDQKGDISTETWFIKNSEMLTDCEVVVYDRQGQRVFNSIGYPLPWDGTYQGKPVPDGAYYYVITCGGKVLRKGSVTIARLK